jgi:hypothetical protein
LEILEWINSLKGMQEAVEGWDDTESYTFHNGWKGSFKVPNAASAAVKKKHKDAAVVDKGRQRRKLLGPKRQPGFPNLHGNPLESQGANLRNQRRMRW